MRRAWPKPPKASQCLECSQHPSKAEASWSCSTSVFLKIFHHSDRDRDGDRVRDRDQQQCDLTESNSPRWSLRRCLPWVLPGSYRCGSLLSGQLEAPLERSARTTLMPAAFRAPPVHTDMYVCMYMYMHAYAAYLWRYAKSRHQRLRQSIRLRWPRIPHQYQSKEVYVCDSNVQALSAVYVFLSVLRNNNAKKQTVEMFTPTSQRLILSTNHNSILHKGATWSKPASECMHVAS